MARVMARKKYDLSLHHSTHFPMSNGSLKILQRARRLTRQNERIFHFQTRAQTTLSGNQSRLLDKMTAMTSVKLNAETEISQIRFSINFQGVIMRLETQSLRSNLLTSWAFLPLLMNSTRSIFSSESFYAAKKSTPISQRIS